MQARLGGPDLGAMINRYGAQRVQSTLALRAGGPILALLLTVSGVIYLTKQWAPGLAMVLAAGWAIALSLMTRPETDL